MLPLGEKRTNVPEREIGVAADDDPSGIQAEGTRRGCPWGINVSRDQGWQCMHKQLSPGPGTGWCLSCSSPLRDHSRGGRTNSRKGALHLGTCSITESITGIKQKQSQTETFATGGDIMCGLQKAGTSLLGVSDAVRTFSAFGLVDVMGSIPS